MTDFRMESSSRGFQKTIGLDPRTLARCRAGLRASTRPREAAEPMATMGRSVAKLTKSSVRVHSRLSRTLISIPITKLIGRDSCHWTFGGLRTPPQAPTIRAHCWTARWMGIPDGVAGRGRLRMRGRDHRAPWRVHSKDAEYRSRNPCIVEGLGADRWEVRLGTPNREISRSSSRANGTGGGIWSNFSK